MRQVHEGSKEGDVCAQWDGVSIADLYRGSTSLANGSSRPGILVLINDADWELEGEGKYEIQEGDDILFVSTLHGG